MREGISGANSNFPLLWHSAFEVIDFIAIFSLEQKKE